VIGTILNATAIVAGGVLGSAVTRQISVENQRRIKILLGAFTVYVGLSMAVTSFGGSFWQIAKQFGIVLLSLMLGKLTGRLLRLQQSLNLLGQYAKRQFSEAQTGTEHRISEGFVTCTVLYCIGPMAVLGPLQDGLKGDIRILLIKSVMDGLATMAFVQSFGWGVILSAVPVFAYQGTITLCAKVLKPYIENQALMDPLYATGGLILFSVALVILELKKVELADYLPSLLYAPLLGWLLR
jgi:uncharacterized membrane protein YqgA involved in biofilm formation